MKKVLIVVDMQNDFLSGSLGSAEALKIVEPIKEFSANFDGEIIFTRDTHGEDYLQTSEGRNLPVKHCIKGSGGWQIAKELSEISEGAIIFDKPTFGSRALAEYLFRKNLESEIEEVILVGVCTDICVISNAQLIKAFLPECKISVISDLCAGVTKESHERALLAMKSCQINIL